MNSTHVRPASANAAVTVPAIRCAEDARCERSGNAFGSTPPGTTIRPPVVQVLAPRKSIYRCSSDRDARSARSNSETPPACLTLRRSGSHCAARGWDASDAIEANAVASSPRRRRTSPARCLVTRGGPVALPRRRRRRRSRAARHDRRDAISVAATAEPPMTANSGLGLLLLGGAGALRARGGCRTARRRCRCWPRWWCSPSGSRPSRSTRSASICTSIRLFWPAAASRPSPGTAGAADRARAHVPGRGAPALRFPRPAPGRVRRSGCRWRPALTALTALLGFVFGAELRYRVTRAPLIGMALPTAVGLLLVSVGLLLERPDGGRDARGDLARSGRAASFAASCFRRSCSRSSSGSSSRSRCGPSAARRWRSSVAVLAAAMTMVGLFVLAVHRGLPEPHVRGARSEPGLGADPGRAGARRCVRRRPRRPLHRRQRRRLPDARLLARRDPRQVDRRRDLARGRRSAGAGAGPSARGRDARSASGRCGARTAATSPSRSARRSSPTVDGRRWCATSASASGWSASCAPRRPSRSSWPNSDRRWCRRSTIARPSRSSPGRSPASSRTAARSRPWRRTDSCTTGSSSHRDPGQGGALPHAREGEDRSSRPYLGATVRARQQPLLIRDVTPAYLDTIAQSDEHRRALRELGSEVVHGVAAAGARRGGRLAGLHQHDAGPPLHRRRMFRSPRRWRRGPPWRSRRRASTGSPSTRSGCATTCSASSPTISAIRWARSCCRRRCSAAAVRERERGSRKPGEVIERAATRMNHLIQDLLDVARMEGGRLTIEQERVSARQAVAEVVQAQEPLATSASLELRLDLAPDLPDLWADRDRLLQIFENLIGNAIKFTEAGGASRWARRRATGDVLFWVADTGIGIAGRRPAARVRAALAGERRRATRRRPGTADRQGHRRGPRGPRLGREHARRREHLLLHDPDRDGRRANGGRNRRPGPEGAHPLLVGSGSGGGFRTPDPAVNSRLLCH